MFYVPGHPVQLCRECTAHSEHLSSVPLSMSGFSELSLCLTQGSMNASHLQLHLYALTSTCVPIAHTYT